MSVDNTSFVRLADGAFEVLERRGAPGRDAFVAYCKKRGLKVKAYAAYGSLRAGEAVDRETGEAFVQYLVHRSYLDASAAETSLVPALPPVVDEGLLATPKTILDTLLGPLHNSLEDRNAHYIRDPDEEIPQIAEHLVRFIGQANPSLDDGLDEIARGEAIMNRSVAEHAEWLRKIHAVDRRAILYGICERRGRSQIVSASVLFATSPEACERFCSGTISDLEIRPSDVLPRGKHLYLSSIVPMGNAIGASEKEIERCQIRSLFTQAAYFSRGLKPFRPTIYTVASSPVYRLRLKRHGYDFTGANVKGCTEPIMRLQHPGDVGRRWSSRQRFAAYSILCFSLKLMQAWNRKRWATPDTD